MPERARIQRYTTLAACKNPLKRDVNEVVVRLGMICTSILLSEIFLSNVLFTSGQYRETKMVDMKST